MRSWRIPSHQLWYLFNKFIGLLLICIIYVILNGSSLRSCEEHETGHWWGCVVEGRGAMSITLESLAACLGAAGCLFSGNRVRTHIGWDGHGSPQKARVLVMIGPVERPASSVVSGNVDTTLLFHWQPVTWLHRDYDHEESHSKKARNAKAKTFA